MGFTFHCLDKTDVGHLSSPDVQYPSARISIFSGGSMGLLDALQNQMTGAGVEANSSHASGIMELIQNYPGGISGLIQQFHSNGLGGIVSSWIGTGQNLPISSDQIQQVLGSGFVQNLAAKAGISPETAGSSISQLLPSLIDKLTPNGQVPQQSDMMSMGSNLLKSFGQS
jgi:uncharacterized protein YidB (DUF937 family)